MARKSKPPISIADTDLPLQCEKCGKGFTKTWAWLNKNDLVPCPHCGHTIGMDDEKRLKLRSAHVQKLRSILGKES
jgi:Zn finger protein HypA/HybF involved in hydrogenase expression